MVKKILILFTSITSLFIFAVPAFAHVIVHPSTVGVAAFQEFTMSVPTEKDNPTVGIKLIIPDGLQMVVPNAKAGWTINEVKTGSADTATVTEIDWTNSSIPVGQRDDFLFQAQVPAKETTLKWKAIQVYQDGSTVSWTHDPTSNPMDDSAPPPYSTTKVVNDLTGSGSNNGMTVKQTNNNTDAPMANGSGRAMLALWFSVIAIALSTVSLSLSRRKK